MIDRLVRTVRVVVLLCGGSRALVLENLALRQQLGMYQRSRPKPAVAADRSLVLVRLCRLWAGWATALVVLRPATVIGCIGAGSRGIGRDDRDRPAGDRA
jgi:hypothetical protein